MSAHGLPRLSGKDLVKLLRQAGFHQPAGSKDRGSHRKLRHESLPLTVIVPLHPEIAVGTMASILRQANLTRDDLRQLMTKSRRGTGAAGLGE